MSKVSTPIVDFLRKYDDSHNIRLHMPGHKGKGALGVEKWDITEISGADFLYGAEGIIAESEKNLAEIFGTKASFYSTEGSSLCIRAMLHAALKVCPFKGRKKIVAAKNVHKTYIYSAALLDFDTVWLTGKSKDLYSCSVDKDELDKALCENEGVCAVYITSPDYLGNVADVQEIAQVCKKHNTPLIVDNAHGAYLKFIKPSMHPVDMGADICCDSAHKTLPVLTGGAYLHVAKDSKYGFESMIKESMSLFASTSPSYLIMASLDNANRVMSEDFEAAVFECANKVDRLRTVLEKASFGVTGDEPLKITLKPKVKGYTGNEIAHVLEQNGVYPEAYDDDNVVFMFSPCNDEADFGRLEEILLALENRTEIKNASPLIPVLRSIMTVRQAMMSMSECVDVTHAEGRILASPSVSCPPAIPIAVCGDLITADAVNCFRYYGVKKIDVIKE